MKKDALFVLTGCAAIPLLALAGVVKAQAANEPPHAGPSSVSPPHSDQSRVDKTNYTLFNPTPREFMREMSTDRPDVTESPITVDGLALAPPAPGHDRVAKGVQDNSFLLEEAYNQEPGVVQHIFNLAWFADERGDADQRELSLVFTQEWPLGSQTHQFSYTVPASHLDDGVTTTGFGDVLLNYRLQLLTETADRPAVAPRFSLILPTGDEDRGLGLGSTGFQHNTAVSKVVADRWTVHGNAGFTLFPDVEDHTLTSYNLGASVIYAATDRLNFLLECRADWDEELVSDLAVVAPPRSERTNSVLLSPGFRYAWNLPDDLQIVAGVAVPIGLTDDSPDYGIFLYLSFEHPFTR